MSVRQRRSVLRLSEVMLIATADFALFPENTDYLSLHTIRDDRTNQQHLKDFTFVFIETPKYKTHENAQGIDEWIDLFQSASRRSTFETSDPIVKKAYEKLEMSNWTAQELIDFQAYQKLLLDNQAREAQVYDEGRLRVGLKVRLK